MANRLKMAKVQTILTLRSRGWSYRRIGRELGGDRGAVRRHVRLAEAGAPAAKPPPGWDVENQPNPPTGSDGQNLPNLPAGSDGRGRPSSGSGLDGQNRPNPPTWSGPQSKAEPYREIIEAKLERGLSYQRIWQDLQTEHGFEGGYDSVKRFGRRLKTARPLPFRRLECGPGEEAQVDFGTGAPIRDPDGKRRRTHVLRVVLSHSRKAYSEAVRRQTTEDFIRCIENAFRHFGGATKTLVVDNLKAAVIKADWFDSDLNPKLQSFCEHYGTVILPTKPRTPRHKG